MSLKNDLVEYLGEKRIVLPIEVLNAVEEAETLCVQKHTEVIMEETDLCVYTPDEYHTFVEDVKVNNVINIQTNDNLQQDWTHTKVHILHGDALVGSTQEVNIINGYDFVDTLIEVPNLIGTEIPSNEYHVVLLAQTKVALKTTTTKNQVLVYIPFVK